MKSAGWTHAGDERERERAGKILGVTGGEGRGRQEEVRPGRVVARRGK